MVTFFSQLFRLSRPYLGRLSQWYIWALFVFIVGLGSTVVYLNVRINAWSQQFYDALGAFNTSLIYDLIKEYSVYIAIYIVVVVYQEWLTKFLIIRWRSAMTRAFIQSWFAERAFYSMALKGTMDNPDQRIAQDIDLFVEKVVRLSISLVSTLTRLFSFTIILWTLSGVQRFTLWGQEFVIHGYLVWIVLLYTLFGSVLTHVIGKKLHKINYQKQKAEADFRASLIRKQDNAEQIAFYGGEAQETQQLKNGFWQIILNWRQLMNAERNLSFFTVGYARISLIIPIFAALPAYLTKVVTFGGLMQIRSAFGQVHGALSWFINMYYGLVELSASMQRLSQFQHEVNALQQNSQTVHYGHQLRLDKLTLLTPHNEVLLSEISLSLTKGKWHQLSGPGGIGKSTLLRTLCGLWPYYRGDWQALSGNTLFLPQQSYLGQGTLAEILCYPNAVPEDINPVYQALEAVELGDRKPWLTVTKDWQHVFSGGERQRIALARALIARPDVLFMDEATSNLDLPSAKRMMSLLKMALPDTTVIVITHQQELTEFFDDVYDLSYFKVAPH